MVFLFRVFGFGFWFSVILSKLFSLFIYSLYRFIEFLLCVKIGLDFEDVLVINVKFWVLEFIF